jgi:hypothetical protein
MSNFTSNLVSYLNSEYNASVKDGQITEEAWDELQKHLYKIEQVIKALESVDKEGN